MQINLNDTVKFELTDRGRALWAEFSTQPQPTELPIWRFLAAFGSRIGNGAPPVTTDNEISIEAQCLDGGLRADARFDGRISALTSFDERIPERDRHDGVRDGTIGDYLRYCGGELAKLREEKAEAARKRDLLADAIAEALGEDWRKRSPVEAVRELARRESPMADSVQHRSDMAEDYTRMRELIAQQLGGPIDDSDDVETAFAEARAALEGRPQSSGSSLCEAGQGTLGALCLDVVRQAIRAEDSARTWELVSKQLGGPIKDSVPRRVTGDGEAKPRRSAIGTIFEIAGERAYEVIAAMAGTEPATVRGAVNLADYMALLIADDVKARPESSPPLTHVAAETAKRPTPSEVALSEFYALHTPRVQFEVRDVEPENALDKPVADAGVRSRLPFNGPVHAVLHVVTECIADHDHEGANRWLDMFERMQSLDLDAEDTER